MLAGDRHFVAAAAGLAGEEPEPVPLDELELLDVLAEAESLEPELAAAPLDSLGEESLLLAEPDPSFEEEADELFLAALLSVR